MTIITTFGIASLVFVAAFTAKNGKPPENHAWIEYASLKMMAQAMNETKSTDTDKLIPSDFGRL